LLLELLQLLALLLDLLLLRLDLLLGLSVGIFVILHFVADGKSSHATESGSDSGTRAGTSDRGANYRATDCAESRAAEGAFLTGGQRLTAAASGYEHCGGQCEYCYKA
jgi:hypothetical protein